MGNLISLIHPSRGRPWKGYDTANKWIEHAGCQVEHIFSLDESDPERSKYQKIDKLLIDNNTSVVEATNKAAKMAKGDILLYLSDDFDCFPDWGLYVTREAAKITRPDWLLKVDDCLQRFEVDVLTIPIMSKALYNKLGYFWHPEYKSMFTDQDLYWTTFNMGCLFTAPHLKFPHQHYSVGKTKIDDTYQRSNQNWNSGKELYHKRKAMNFPL